MARSTAAAVTCLAFVLVFVASASGSTPTISYSIDGIVGTNGWYRGSTHGDNVVLHWSVSFNATSSNCLAAVTIPGPTAGATQTCWAVNADGRTTAVTHPIKIDATPPSGITARFTRSSDFNGWYNHPVGIRWSGTDATSGVAGCSSVTYRGPDSGAASVNGGCTDKAGNTAVRAVRLAYDATPPVLHGVTELSTAAADLLRWSSTSASDRVVVRRSVRARRAHTTVYAGSAGEFTDKRIRAGTEYVYSVQSFDQAGNSSRVVSIAGLPKVLTLRKTGRAPRAAPNPILRWGRVRGAGYYNVQLFRGSKRIFAAWPTSHQIALRPSWKWAGRRFSLRPGRYRWYVWAGFGPRRLASYRALGSARFVVPRG